MVKKTQRHKYAVGSLSEMDKSAASRTFVEHREAESLKTSLSMIGKRSDATSTTGSLKYCLVNLVKIRFDATCERRYGQFYDYLGLGWFHYFQV